jgi:hypothetical protein
MGPHSRGTFRPGYANDHPLENQRAQGRPGGRCTRGSRAKNNCASAKTTGTDGDHTGLPRAMVYGLYALSPVSQLIATVALAKLFSFAGT